MIWKGKELNTIADLMDAISAIDQKGEAEEFMTTYRAENEHADENIGYLTGYFDPETMGGKAGAVRSRAPDHGEDHRRDARRATCRRDAHGPARTARAGIDIRRKFR